MQRRTATRILVAYFAVLWIGVAVRCDFFPLTWVPMYSHFTPQEELCIRAKDDARLEQGLLVTHRDGSTSNLSHADLNMPKWNFWRLYVKRMFSKGPPLHVTGDDWKKNQKMHAFNHWLHGTAGMQRPEEGWGEGRWEWVTFRSLNRTLGMEPDDPGFVVRVETAHDEGCYETADPSNSRRVERRVVWEWREAWKERWLAASS